LPVPVAGDTVSHAAFDVTDTAVFDVTATAVEPPASGAAHDAADKVNVGATCPGWDTVKVRVTTGEPEVVVNVTVAVRAAVAVFA